MKICPICKANIQEEARFCLYCMTSFEEKQPIDDEKAPRRRRRPVLWLLVAAVLVTAVGAVFLAANGWAKDPTGPSLPSHGTSSPADTNPASAVPSSKAAYSYEPATAENLYPEGSTPFSLPENAIVITGVTATVDNGHYVIPDTIDGQRVLSVTPTAFCDPSVCDSVFSVTLPETVRFVPDGAFEACNNLTDVYLACAVVDLSEAAFAPVQNRTGTLTLHAARDCRNSDFYYYRNIADRYGAVYEEWSE